MGTPMGYKSLPPKDIKSLRSDIFAQPEEPTAREASFSSGNVTSINRMESLIQTMNSYPKRESPRLDLEFLSDLAEYYSNGGSNRSILLSFVLSGPKENSVNLCSLGFMEVLFGDLPNSFENLAKLLSNSGIIGINRFLSSFGLFFAVYFSSNTEFQAPISEIVFAIRHETIDFKAEIQPPSGFQQICDQELNIRTMFSNLLRSSDTNVLTRSLSTLSELFKSPKFAEFIGPLVLDSFAELLPNNYIRSPLLLCVSSCISECQISDLDAFLDSLASLISESEANEADSISSIFFSLLERFGAICFEGNGVILALISALSDSSFWRRELAAKALAFMITSYNCSQLSSMDSVLYEFCNCIESFSVETQKAVLKAMAELICGGLISHSFALSPETLSESISVISQLTDSDDQALSKMAASALSKVEPFADEMEESEGEEAEYQKWRV